MKWKKLDKDQIKIHNKQASADFSFKSEREL